MRAVFLWIPEMTDAAPLELRSVVSCHEGAGSLNWLPCQTRESSVYEPSSRKDVLREKNVNKIKNY